MFTSFLLFTALPSEAADVIYGQPVVERFEGTVIDVRRPDTVVLLSGQRRVTVRLVGVHALEPTQRFAESARETATRVLIGQTVKVAAISRRRYGHCIGDIELRGRSVSKSLVAAGLVWHYDAVCADDELALFQATAKSLGRGLWRHGDAVPPWVAQRQTAMSAMIAQQRASDRRGIDEPPGSRTPLAQIATTKPAAGLIDGGEGRSSRRERNPALFDSRHLDQPYR